jgi:hypothetical protein
MTPRSPNLQGTLSSIAALALTALSYNVLAMPLSPAGNAKTASFDVSVEGEPSFKAMAVGQTYSMKATITSKGPAVVTFPAAAYRPATVRGGNAVSFGPDDPDFKIVKHNCPVGTPFAVGTRCVVEYTVTPSTVGPIRSAALPLWDFAPQGVTILGSPYTVQYLWPNGGFAYDRTKGAIRVERADDPAAQTYWSPSAPVKVGASSPVKYVKLTNISEAPGTVHGIEFKGMLVRGYNPSAPTYNGELSFEPVRVAGLTNCAAGMQLNKGQGCVIGVVFKPKASDLWAGPDWMGNYYVNGSLNVKVDRQQGLDVSVYGLAYNRDPNVIALSFSGRAKP